MNEAEYYSLIQKTRPINYGINKSLERKVRLNLTLGYLAVVKIYCCVINCVFLNTRSENKTPFESF